MAYKVSACLSDVSCTVGNSLFFDALPHLADVMDFIPRILVDVLEVVVHDHAAHVFVSTAVLRLHRG